MGLGLRALGIAVRRDVLLMLPPLGMNWNKGAGGGEDESGGPKGETRPDSRRGTGDKTTGIGEATCINESCGLLSTLPICVLVTGEDGRR